MTIEEAGLSVNLRTSLWRAQINTVEELALTSDERLRWIDGIGAKYLMECRDVIQKYSPADVLERRRLDAVRMERQRLVRRYTMSEREFAILSLREEGLSRVEIGRKFGIDSARVRQMEQKAKKKMIGAERIIPEWDRMHPEGIPQENT